MKKLLAIALSIVMLVGICGPLFADSGNGMFGAIFTTDESGSRVNQNSFASKDDVYLNGGPQKPGTAGLPDGFYYVQVTNPSGSQVLGRTPTASVEVGNEEVRDEEFTKLYKLTEILQQYDGISPVLDAEKNPIMGFSDSENGVYKVWVSQYANFPSNASKTDNFKINSEEKTVMLTVQKFYDKNADGQYDKDKEQLLENWLVNISNNGDQFTTYTASVIPDDNYTIREYLPTDENGIIYPHWVATALTERAVTISNEDLTVSFGNIYLLDLTGGHALGFWSNKIGTSIINKNNYYSQLSELNLKNAAGPYIPSAKTFNTWLLRADASYMQYMLSAQLATMKLNVLYGFVAGDTNLYISDGLKVMANEGEKTFKSISINDLINYANKALSEGAVYPEGLTLRQYQESLKNILDWANNNKLKAISPIPGLYDFIY